MRIVALDMALTNTGYAVHDDGLGHSSGVLTPEKLFGYPRVAWLLERVAMLTTGADLTLIEDYAYAAEGDAKTKLHESGGIIRFWLWRSKRRFIVVAPTALKKFATGNHMAGKPQMHAEAIKRLGYQGYSYDEADALWLLQLAKAHFNIDGIGATNQKQRDVLSKIHWPDLSLTTTGV